MQAYDRFMGFEVEVDGELCMGSGNCVYEAPGVFDLNEDSVAFVVDPAASSEEQIITAARKCPTHAITVRRDGVSLL